jgi:membrane protease YdiL (CAAX protease family)
MGDFLMGPELHGIRDPIRTTDTLTIPALPPDANRPDWRDLLSVLAIVWYAIVVLMVGIMAFWTLFYGVEEEFIEGPEEILLDALIAAIAMAAAWAFACRKQGRSFASGFEVVPIGARAFITSLFAGTMCAVVAIGLSRLLSSGPSDLEEYLIQPSGNGWPGAEVFYPVLLIALPLCLCSEIFYRGFVFPVLRRSIGPFGAALLTVGLGTFHWLIFISNERNFFDPLYLAVIGVILTWMRHRYDSLLPCLVARSAGEITYVVWLIASFHYASG